MTDFASIFAALTGRQPFPWQVALHARFIAGDIPDSAGLPTGLGKTSVIAIWLIALAQRPDIIPRRLVYVVNRRTVVDQTTDEIERLRSNLREAGLQDVLEKLASFPDQAPLAISTLRGQFADNREWSGDPARPAVICGTVDMIGSRLLFSGYGIGFKQRPLHAGFLAQDALLVHDEAHLEPAFQDLLNAIQTEQKRCGDFRPLRVMELTATSRSTGRSFGLTSEELSPPFIIPASSDVPVHVVWRRQKAAKKICLEAENEVKDIVLTILKRALELKESECAVLVFLRSVDDVTKVVAGLVKEVGASRVQHLTGTLRGYERDRLVSHDPVFVRFMPVPKPNGTAETVFLVCTSAGEVGVNMSADHLVSDLTTFDSMAQRLGRVNRFGDRIDSEVHIVHPRKFGDEDAEKRLQKTLDLLTQLKGDGCPLALSKLDPEESQAAFAAAPVTLPATDILFDAWALTSVRDRLPGRPPVAEYLHGVAVWEPPRTQVAWRDEVAVITGDLLIAYPPVDLLDDYPLKPHEVLSDTSKRVAERLAKLADLHPDDPAWLIPEGGEITALSLKELSEDPERIAGCTILLSPGSGGLHKGLFDGRAEGGDQLDVADLWTDQRGPRRKRVWDETSPPAGMRLIRALDTWPVTVEVDDDAVGDVPSGRWWRWYERPDAADGEGSRGALHPVTLAVHLQDVRTNAERIVRALGLPLNLQQAVILAAWAHDLGKGRTLWQRGIGNPDVTRVLAKSGAGMVPLDLSPYRHEFGSLIDVEREAAFQTLGSDLPLEERALLCDLVLHLIAAHHGRARPHFPADEVFDPTATPAKALATAIDVSLRFARLQRHFGRWGLAYLESLVRASDYAASAHPSSYDILAVEIAP